MPPPRLAGAPRGISGDGRPPWPAAATTASKKRRSTFVAPTRPTAPRPGVVLPRQDFNAWVDPTAVRPRQVPNAALAPGTSLPRQLFQAPPPGPRLPAPLSHEAPNAGRKAQTPSFSEPGRLPSHQVQKTSMEAVASDTRRTASTTSMQDDGRYLISSSTPFSDWTPTPTTENTLQAEEHQKREERWKAEKELEERKLLWDQEQKIMFCDMSNMDESQRAYVMAMRQQIAAAKVASVKASVGGSTSEQGSVGDAEEAESLM
ncbi:unnamed protein product [Urochloa decumbens]|uniref:No apical meristem-associated C-terminal domain-containing protein n=1 Tax=Urochloa decumbens TaxID=240449 RepID=A0ABC9AWS4_9POAL